MKFREAAEREAGLGILFPSPAGAAQTAHIAVKILRDFLEFGSKNLTYKK